MTSSNKPIRKLTDANITASIWRNERDNGGPFYTVTFSRFYKDEAGNYRDTTSFSGVDLLRLAQLAQNAYAVIDNLRLKDQLAGLHTDPAPTSYIDEGVRALDAAMTEVGAV